MKRFRVLILAIIMLATTTLLVGCGGGASTINCTHEPCSYSEEDITLICEHEPCNHDITNEIICNHEDGDTIIYCDHDIIVNCNHEPCEHNGGNEMLEAEWVRVSSFTYINLNGEVITLKSQIRALYIGVAELLDISEFNWGLLYSKEYTETNIDILPSKQNLPKVVSGEYAYYTEDGLYYRQQLTYFYIWAEVMITGQGQTFIRTTNETIFLNNIAFEVIYFTDYFQ